MKAIEGVTQPLDVKSIWVSDLHIGSHGAQIDRFVSFLANINCETLFLNGDIIDKWLLKKEAGLDRQIERIKAQLMAIKKRGIYVMFLSGNHDGLIDIKHFFPEFPCVSKKAYTAVNKKRYLVFHGDVCDPSVNLKGVLLARLGTYIYNWSLSYRKKSNTDKHFSRTLKIGVKKAVNFIFNYDRRLYKYAKKQAVNGIICGHSHQPKIKKIKEMDYLNSGDWIDNCTFLVEDFQGCFKLMRWEQP